MECRCPNCSQLFAVTSRAFGEPFICAKCGFTETLDTDYLARFELPRRLLIEVRSRLEPHRSGLPVTILVSRGDVDLPPLLTGPDGNLTISREMFRRAETEHVQMAMMDHKGQADLHRYIRIMTPSAREAERLMAMRLGSGWPASAWEVELYGNLNGLARACKAGALAAPESVVTRVDLASGLEDFAVVLEL